MILGLQRSEKLLNLSARLMVFTVGSLEVLHETRNARKNPARRFRLASFRINSQNVLRARPSTRREREPRRWRRAREDKGSCRCRRSPHRQSEYFVRASIHRYI